MFRRVGHELMNEKSEMTGLIGRNRYFRAKRLGAIFAVGRECLQQELF